MVGYVKPQLSLWEKLRLTFNVFRTLSTGLVAAVTGPFRGDDGAPTWLDHVKITMTRRFTEVVTPRDIQFLGEGMDTQYEAFAKKKGVEAMSITLPSGIKAHWFGNPYAENVLIWFHGGGYNIPPDVHHLPFLFSIATPKVAVLMLAYSLYPTAHYPTQLKEAVELIQHLTKENGFSMQNISLGGDSAGGNLAIAVLSHIMHPHPQVPPINQEAKTLGSLILLGPWVSFETTATSFKTNAKKDIISIQTLKEWAANFLGSAPKDGYNEPLSLKAGDPWWEALELTVAEILVVAGGNEVMVDPIREFIRIIEGVHPRVKSVIVKDEYHDQPVNLIGGSGQQAEAIRSFIINMS